MGEGWTERVLTRLKEHLSDKNHSAASIAMELNKEFSTSFTRNAVVGKVQRLNLKLPRCYLVPRTAQYKPRQNIARRQSASSETPPLLVDAVDRQIPFGQRKTLMKLADRGECKWPVGDPQDADFFFCAAASFGESPYCAEHTARAFEGLRRRPSLRRGAGDFVIKFSKF